MSSANPGVLWRLAAALTVVLLCGFTCVSAAPQTNKNIVPPTPSPSPTPPPSPTQASTPASITGIPMPGGEVGIAYTASLAASGGPTPYTWSLDSGALPAGLTLGADGGVSGVPTAPGTFSFTVKASDATNQYTTQGATIKVYAPLGVLTQPCAVKCNIGAGCRRCGGFGTVGGGVGPYSYRVVGGAVPAGMALNGLAVTGAFPKGAFSLDVQVTDQLGGQATVHANWNIYGPALLVKGGDCIDTTNNPTTCAVRWTYSGGDPLVGPSLTLIGYAQYCNVQGLCMTPKSLPVGWAVSVTNGVITMSTNDPACVVQYLGTLRFALADPVVCATTLSNEVDLVVYLDHAC